jgi:hypothetical protein
MTEASLSKRELADLGNQVSKCMLDISDAFKTAAEIVGKAVNAYGLDAVVEAWEDKVPSRMIRQLLFVHEGRLLPYFITHLGFSSTALRLSCKEQERIAEDKPFPMWTPTGNLMVKPSKMEPLQKRQIFGPDGIRDDAAQRAWLESQSHRPAKEQAEESSVVFDAKKGLIVHGNATIPPGEILKYAGMVVQKRTI